MRSRDSRVRVCGFLLVGVLCAILANVAWAHISVTCNRNKSQIKLHWQFPCATPTENGKREEIARGDPPPNPTCLTGIEYQQNPPDASNHVIFSGCCRGDEQSEFVFTIGCSKAGGNAIEAVTDEPWASVGLRTTSDPIPPDSMVRIQVDRIVTPGVVDDIVRLTFLSGGLQTRTFAQNQRANATLKLIVYPDTITADADSTLLIGAGSAFFGEVTLVGVSGALVPAGPAPTLGGVGTFEILASSTVTNTGPTTVIGDVGVSTAGGSITGFPPGTITGSPHPGDAVAAAAQDSLTTAYNDLAGRACNVPLTGTDLGGLTLSSGVYCFSSSAQLTGTLTLDGQGNSNAVFVFQIGSTLTTASNAAVVLTNGAQARNVFWQVGSSATLGTGTDFQGNILANVSISLNTGTSIVGRALARTGAVTMDTNAASLPSQGFLANDFLLQDNGGGMFTARPVPGLVKVALVPDATTALVSLVGDPEAAPAGTTGIGDENIPSGLWLGSAVPNPARGEMRVRFAIPNSGHVTLRIYDQQGRHVRELIAGRLPAGIHEAGWDGRDAAGRQVPSAAYFYRLEMGRKSLTGKVFAIR